MLLDLQHVDANRANATVDLLCKSMEERMADDPHPTDTLVGAMEDATTLPIRRCLLGLHDALLTLLVTHDPILHKAAREAAWWPVIHSDCQKLEARVLLARGGSLHFTDYIDVLDCLMLRYLPPQVLRDQVKALAVKQYVTGHLRAQDLTGEDHAARLAALPVS